MNRTLCIALLGALLPLAGAPARAADGARWSTPAGGLAGRLVVLRRTIVPAEAFEVYLELKNTGGVPVVAQAHNPFAVRLELQDDQGRVVKPTSGRLDVLSAPTWAVVPHDAYLGFRLTIGGKDGAAGAQLDLITSIWKLRRGVYTLRGTYSSTAFATLKPRPVRDKVWIGELALPPITIKVQ